MCEQKNTCFYTKHMICLVIIFYRKQISRWIFIYLKQIRRTYKNMKKSRGVLSMKSARQENSCRAPIDFASRA